MTTDRRPTHALAASAVLAPVVAAVGTGLAYAVRDLVPDPVAVHWGLDGEPDRWQSYPSAVVTAAVITIVMPLALVALAAVMHRSARGPLAAVAGGLAVFLAGLLFGGLVAQRPGQVPQAFPPQWVVPTLVLSGAIVVRHGPIRWIKHGWLQRRVVGALILALVLNGMNLLGVKTFWQAGVLGLIILLSVLADQLVGGRINRTST